MEPLESTSAVNLTKGYLEGIFWISAAFTRFNTNQQLILSLSLSSFFFFQSSKTPQRHYRIRLKKKLRYDILKARAFSHLHSFETTCCCKFLASPSFFKVNKAEAWNRHSHFQLFLGTRRFGFCRAVVGSNEKEWVKFTIEETRIHLINIIIGQWK